jgi:hypothetical protein
MPLKETLTSFPVHSSVEGAVAKAAAWAWKKSLKAGGRGFSADSGTHEVNEPIDT